MITEPNEFMQRLQELQDSSSVTYSTLPSNEPRFIIDANSRTIKIPPEFQFLGVKNDHKAETVYFEIDRYFDNEDLSTHTCVVQFENKSGEGSIYPVTIVDTESIDGKIIFGWEILSDATTIVGDIIFSVRFYSLDNYVFTYNFNTLPAKSVILDTLNVDDPTVLENYPSELEAWLDRMNDLSQNVVKPEDVELLDTKMDTLETSFGELETNVNSSVDELKSDLDDLESYLADGKIILPIDYEYGSIDTDGQYDSDIKRARSKEYIPITEYTNVNISNEEHRYVTSIAYFDENKVFKERTLILFNDYLCFDTQYSYAKLIIVNYDGESYDNQIDLKSVKMSYTVLRNDKDDLKNDIQNINETLEGIVNYGSKIFTDYNWLDGYTLTSTDGTIISNSYTHHMSVCDFIRVTKGAIISITGIGAIQRIWRYDSNKTVIADSLVELARESYIYTATDDIYIRFAIDTETESDNYTSKDLITTIVNPTIEIKTESIPNRSISNKKIVSDWKDKAFVTFGDSITYHDGHAYPSGEVAIGYQSIIKEKLGFAYYLNMGLSGMPLANGTDRGNGVCEYIMYKNYSNYDLAIIACGTNDFRLNVPLGTKQNKNITHNRDTFYGALQDSIEDLLTKKPNIRICLFTPLQRNNDGYTTESTNTSGHKLVDYVNAIREVGEMYSVPVCDMYSNSGITELNLSYYTHDGLHPNNNGYERMGDYASKFIDNIGL